MEGVDSKVEAMFYRVVVQEVLLFGLYLWVLLEAMEIKVEETNNRFLRQIMGKWEQQKLYRKWYTPRV